ncbi:MAG: hypothetical protein ACI93T_000528 [Porticoccaceae bacterium]
MNKNAGLPKKRYSGFLSSCTKCRTIQIALRTGQTLEFRHFDDQLKQELTVMSRKLMACLAMTSIVLTSSGRDSIADGLDDKAKKQVAEIVAKEIANLLQKGDENSEQKKQRPILHSALDEVLEEAQRSEERAKLGNALKRLIASSDGSTTCDSGCFGTSLLVTYRRANGSIDFGEFIEHEVRQQELIEERQKLGKALKRLISGDECKTEGKTSGVSYSSSNYCPPGYAPVVIEPGPPPYWRYVNLDD